MNFRGAGLRELAYVGARYGPVALVKYGPALFGVAFGCASPDLRAGVRANVRRLRGPRTELLEEVDVFRTIIAYAHCFTESLAGERPEAKKAEAVIRDGERLDAVLAEGRGAVLVTAHTGAWDAAAAFLARHRRTDVLVAMAPEHDERARAISDRVRARSGLRVVHVGDHALDALPLLGHLKRGGLVAMQLDRAVNPLAAVRVQLGSLPFCVPRGPFHLAKVSRAPIVPVFARRLGYFRYELTVLEPIRIPFDASPELVGQAAVIAARAMETYLLRYPTQWFHFPG